MAKALTLSAGNKASPLVTWMALFAFFLQGLIVQSHIHEDVAVAPAGHHGQIHQGQQPDRKSPADCPICQAQAAASSVMLPHVVVGFIPLAWIAAEAKIERTLDMPAAKATGWQSRAPPLP